MAKPITQTIIAQNIGHLGDLIGNSSGRVDVKSSGAMQLDQRKIESLVSQANDALGRCLEKSSFITASYFDINTQTKEIRFVRAGHCPTLYYDASNKESRYLKTKGMGLGIVRNSEYTNYVYCNTLTYAPGDIILLYTDGITEATDVEGRQFGNEGLKNAMDKHINLSSNGITPEELKNGIIEELYAFLNGKKLDDDYTLMIIKLEA